MQSKSIATDAVAAIIVPSSWRVVRLPIYSVSFLFSFANDAPLILPIIWYMVSNEKTGVGDMGLAAGERVVVDGQLRLDNGTRVAIRQPAGTLAPMTQPLPVAGG